MGEEMIAGIAAWLARSALMQSPIGGFLKLVPARAWKALAIVAVLIALFFWHQHAMHKALKAADHAGYERRADEEAKALARFTAKVDEYTRATDKIAREARTRNDQQALDIRRAGDALSVRGPGKARTGRPAAVPASSGEHGTASGNAPGPAATVVPASDGQDEFAAVPWSWLVGTGTQCDLDAAEVIEWRGWYQRQVAEWEKLRRALATDPK
jgi:uncharacterized membrane protein